MKLLRDNIICKKMATPEKVGLLFVPEGAQRGTTIRCQVMDVGQGLKPRHVKEYITLDVEPGDVVYIPKFAGNQISIDGVDYFLIKSSDVLCVEIKD